MSSSVPPLLPPTLSQPPPLPSAKPPPLLSPDQALRKLFKILFLRGRSARGVVKETAPKSFGAKLLRAIVIYALIGLFALSFRHSVFAVSVYLHAVTLAFIGMFVAGSAGEVLFNKEEGDILLHRPVTPRMLLRAKMSVMLEVGLWLAGSLNLVGLIVGATVAEVWWLFPLVHALSVLLNALFCLGAALVLYQVCLRWLGRERLDNVMTAAQVCLSIAVIVGGQVAPHIARRFASVSALSSESWWIALFPPAWFACIDISVAGRGSTVSWSLAGAALLATAIVLWLGLGKLAHSYESGLQSLNESTAAERTGGRRWISSLVNAPLFRWWLRDSASRAAFLLVAAYLGRDRETKLRIFPGVAPLLVMPVVFLLQSGQGSEFGLAMAGTYLALIPVLALDLLRYTQQWGAADLFRIVPLRGPGPLCHGARRAAISLLVVPMLFIFSGIALVMRPDFRQLMLLLPGAMLIPVFALVPHLRGDAVPLSTPAEEAKSASRGITVFVVMIFAAAFAGIVSWAWTRHWFRWLIAGELLFAAITYLVLRRLVSAAAWRRQE